MKAIVYDIQGNKKKEIELPSLFGTKIRREVVQKLYEAEKLKLIHPNSNYQEAGKRHSAAGTISHKRHDWKGHYGKGISRIPRKTMWRRGTQFYWVGAEISGTRGGRRAHPPKLDKRIRKINKKEKVMGIHSALAATAHEDYLKKRYSSLNKFNIKLPIILESISNPKVKDFIKFLKGVLGDLFKLVLKNKTIRAGKGKSRGRRYKSNAGLLLVKSEEENIKMKGISIKSTNELSITDLYPLGRLTIYTEKALEELGGKR